MGRKKINKNKVHLDSPDVPAKVMDKKDSDTSKEEKAPFIDLHELMEYIEKAKTEDPKSVSKKKQMEEYFTTLDNIIPEFYNACIILGYNALGEKTVYFYAPTEKDRDSLIEHLRSTFMKFVSGMSNNG